MVSGRSALNFIEFDEQVSNMWEKRRWEDVSLWQYILYCTVYVGERHGLTERICRLSGPSQRELISCIQPSICGKDPALRELELQKAVLGFLDILQNSLQS